jgi:hypothetical protein
VCQRRDYRVCGGHLRVSSFAECNGRLYAAIGQQIYERIDGAQPHWRLVYTNRYPGHSETGLRGLTAIARPTGHDEVLLATVEGNAARLVRVDPRDGSEATEFDLANLLGAASGMQASYVIAAYNNMTKTRDPGGGEALLIGLEAFVPANEPIAAGHNVVNVGYGRLEILGAACSRTLRPPSDRRTVRAAAGGDAVDPGFTVSSRKGRTVFFRLRCKQGAGSQHRLDLPVDDRRSDRCCAVVIGPSLGAHRE